jgi:hypothetical protein
VATSTKHKMHPDAKKMAAKDATLIAGLVLTPLYKNPQMIQGLVKVVQGAGEGGPAPPLAHAIFAMISGARNRLIKENLPIDPRAWLAPGGAIDKIIMDIGGLLQSVVGPQFVDKTFGQNVKRELIKIMKQEKDAATSQNQDQEPDPNDPNEAAEGEPQGQPPQGLLMGGMQ